MHRNRLIEQIKEKRSYLCVGLDTDINKIPSFLRKEKNAVVNFNKAIIDVTKDVCVAYKINTAFYEAMGAAGWDAMEETLMSIPSTHLKIADAKRADIGNTSSYYAKAFFETLPFDAITVAPYMGEDSIRPFLEYEDKWTIVLGLTSNNGAADFETLKLAGNDVTQVKGSKQEMLFQRVISKVSSWGTKNNLMFVAGATKSSELALIREIVPDHFLLVPGVGFQGGSLADLSANGLNENCGLLVNASRAIIYAADDEQYQAEAREIASQYQTEMQSIMMKAGIQFLDRS